MTQTEPEWDDESRNLALALAYLEDDTCPGCGGRLSELVYDEKKQPPRVDAAHYRCLGCEALHDAQHAWHKRDEADRKAHKPVRDNARRWFVQIIPRRARELR